MSRRPPRDGAAWIGGLVVGLWVALAGVLLVGNPNHESRARAAEFQTLIGARAAGASMDAVGGRTFLPGMTRPAGPSDHTLLPGGVAIGRQGARDALPYVETPTLYPP